MTFLERLPATAALGLLLGLGVPTLAEASHKHGRSCGHRGYDQSYRPAYSYPHSYRYRPPVRYAYVPRPVYYRPYYRPYYVPYAPSYRYLPPPPPPGISVRIGFGWPW